MKIVRREQRTQRYIGAAAWKTKPSWYIVSKLDGAIALDEERFFAKRMKRDRRRPAG